MQKVCEVIVRKRWFSDSMSIKLRDLHKDRIMLNNQALRNEIGGSWGPGLDDPKRKWPQASKRAHKK